MKHRATIEGSMSMATTIGTDPGELEIARCSSATRAADELVGLSPAFESCATGDARV